MGQVKFTTTQIEQVLDGRFNSFRQALNDSQYVLATPRALLDSTQYVITNNGGLSNEVTSPTYITSRWDSTNNKIAMPEELDNPTYVNDLTFTFDPTSPSPGEGTVRVYIDESGTRDFTTDPLIRSYPFDFKADPEPVSVISTWFFGDATGFDAKNNGVYFTVEVSLAGDLYGTFFSIYRT